MLYICIISNKIMYLNSLELYAKNTDPEGREKVYSALPDVYGLLHFIRKAQHTRVKSWRVGKIIEN
jgi:hypothetical protein